MLCKRKIKKEAFKIFWGQKEKSWWPLVVGLNGADKNHTEKTPKRRQNSQEM